MQVFLKKNAMKQLILLFVLVALAGPVVFAQTIVCDTSGWVFNRFVLVTARSGVVLRAEPSVQSARLAAIPWGMEIPADANTDEMPYDTIEGKEGYWHRVCYAGKTGYVFGGFLERLYEKTSVQFVVPGAGVDSELENIQLDTGLHWYALAPPANARSTGDAAYRFLEGLPVDRRGQTNKGVPGAEQLTLPPETALLLGGITPDRIAGQYYHPEETKMLFPGDVIPFYLFDPALNGYRYYQVYASGQPVHATADVGNWPFSAIRKYELRVREVIAQAGPGPNPYLVAGDQLLFGGRLTFDRDIAGFPAPHVYMLGDFDADHQLDAILSMHTDKGVTFYLFLSSKALPGFLMRVVATRRDACC